MDRAVVSQQQIAANKRAGALFAAEGPPVAMAEFVSGSVLGSGERSIALRTFEFLR